MKIKEIKKQIKRGIAFHALRVCYVVLCFIPKPVVYFLAEFCAKIGYFIAIRHRRTAYESLNIAFGNDKTPAEIKKIVKDCFTNMAKGILEMLAHSNDPQSLGRLVSFEGKDNLDCALSKGKGVIIISGHFGNFPLLLAKLAVSGYKVNILLRKMRDGKTDEYFNRKRLALGIKSIYTQSRIACVSNSINALRNNEIVFMLMDQNFGSGSGVFVDFFGRKAATATGPVIFALRTGAPIIPVFIMRNPDGKTHKLIIEPELLLADALDKDKVIQESTAKITAIIERYVRKFPAEWGWIHRRWKNQPKPSAEDKPEEKNNE